MGHSDTDSGNILKSVHIRNFRVFKQIEIDDLRRINLITGCNNSGKTSLLEALFLLSGGGQARLALNTHVVRVADQLPQPPHPAILREIFWTPMFYALETSEAVEIAGVHSSHGELSLRIMLEPAGERNVIRFPLQESRETSAKNLSWAPGLNLSFKSGTQPEATTHIRPTGQTIEVKESSKPPPFPAVFLSTRPENPQEIASRLGMLRKGKKEQVLLDALKIIACLSG